MKCVKRKTNYTCSGETYLHIDNGHGLPLCGARKNSPGWQSVEGETTCLKCASVQ